MVMRGRFGRRRRRAEGGRPIDESWLQRAAQALPVETLTRTSNDDIPDSMALTAIGSAEDGAAWLVSVSPASGVEALLAALAAASRHEGELATVVAASPNWDAPSYRLLGAVMGLGRPVRPVVLAPEAGSFPNVEAAPLAIAHERLADQLADPAERSAFQGALAALAGLAAKHEGALRSRGAGVELVLAGAAMAQLRAEGERAVLEILQPSRSAHPLSNARLGEVVDRLEGQLRKRANDRKIRDGEEGLRGRLTTALAAAASVHSLVRWPLAGAGVEAVDAVGVGADGVPVVIGGRQKLGLDGLAALVRGALVIEPALGVLTANAPPPVRLGQRPRLLLAALELAPSVSIALRHLTLPVDLHQARAAEGPFTAVDFGTPPPPSRQASRQASAPASRPASAPASRPASAPASRPEPDSARAPTPEARTAEAPDRGRSDAETTADASTEEAPADVAQRDGESGDRPRRRRRRRGGRNRSGGGDAGAEAGREAGAEAGREGGTDAEGGRQEARGDTRRGAQASDGAGDAQEAPRFEELSLFDLDDGDDEPAPRRRRRGRGGRSDDSEGGSAGAADASEGSEPHEARGGSERRRRKGRGGHGGRSEDAAAEDRDSGDDDVEDLLELSPDAPDLEETELPSYEEEEGDEPESEADRIRLERERRRRDRASAGPDAAAVGETGGSSSAGEAEEQALPKGRAAILAHADRESITAAILLAREVRQIEGIWIYPQEELMTFFRGVATDLRENTPIYVIGFAAKPARDALQAASLYRGRLVWFDHHDWPPEDLGEIKSLLGESFAQVRSGGHSSLPAVLTWCTRRSRFSDKLVDLVTGRFTQHDFQRWGRLWWWRLGELSSKTGDHRGNVEMLLAGRPSDLAKEAVRATAPPPPDELEWVSGRDFRLVHFGGMAMVAADVPAQLDLHMAMRIARERYGAVLSLARVEGDDVFILGADDVTGKRSVDVGGMVEHLAEKFAWIEGLPDEDHVARLRAGGAATNADRVEELIAEIGMGRTILEG